MTEYKLKNNVMSPNRIRKMCKEIMKECKDDKDKALEAYELFFNDFENKDSKKCMVECLKIAQNSKSDVIKLMSLLMKYESNGSTNKAGNSGDESLTYEELSDLEMDD